MKSKILIYAGFAAPLVFWITLLICNLLTDNYDPFINMVSELGAYGTKTQYIFTIGLVITSVLSVLFIIGLIKQVRQNSLSIIPVLIIFTFSLSVLGAGIFPMPYALHGILGSPSLLLPLSPLLTLILWNKKTIPGIKTASLIILLIMSLGFLTKFPGVLENYFGLKQRFFHFGWSIWFIYLSFRFLSLNKRLINVKS